MESNVPRQTQELQSFVEVCDECQRTCSETASHCLSVGGEHADVQRVQVLLNCARVCRTSAASSVVGSRLCSQICRACAKLCEECARFCERFAADHQMKTCAELCHACAESCRRMALEPRRRARRSLRSA